MDDRDRGQHEPFRLLFVCTGNICRSPFAELHTRFLLEAWLGPGAGRFAVASAGVGAVVDSGMHPLSREQLASRRDHPAVEAFRARQLPEPEVAAADLVLTMNRRQRSRVLQDVPSALRRTFTLREFARLLDRVDPASLPPDPVARARALVPAALAARGEAGPVPADDDAVPDPIGGEADLHVDVMRVVDAAVRRLLGVVVPPPALRRPVPPVPRSGPAHGPGRPGPTHPGPGHPGPGHPGHPAPGRPVTGYDAGGRPGPAHPAPALHERPQRRIDLVPRDVPDVPAQRSGPPPTGPSAATAPPSAPPPAVPVPRTVVTLRPRVATAAD